MGVLQRNLKTAPISIVALLGFFAFSWIFAKSQAFAPMEVWLPVILVPLISVFLISVIYDLAKLMPFKRWFKKNDKKKTGEKSGKGDSEDEAEKELTEEEKFLRWVESEKPIESEEEDSLYHRPIAHRMAEYLSNQEKMQSVSLLGAYGSGKTSILNMVEEKLTGKDILFKITSCWGWEPEKLIHHVLKESIDLIHEYVDCLSIATIPSEYVRFFENVEPRIGSFLSSILFKDESPEEVLEKLDQFLQAADLRLVLAFEDVDRNPQTEGLQKELAAFLDKQQELKAFKSIVTGSIETGLSEKVVRICDHQERVPAISLRNTNEKLTSFFQFTSGVPFEEIGTEYSEDQHIDCLSLEKRRSKFWIDFDRSNLEGPGPSINKHINKALDSPRKLKSTLRRSLSFWENLKGNIEPMDLLIFCILTNEYPSTIDFCQRNINNLLYGFRSSDQENAMRRFRIRFQEEWDKVISGIVP